MSKPKKGAQAAVASGAQSTVDFEVVARDSTGVAILFSNHATVLHTGSEFILSFFQVHPPDVLPRPGQEVKPLPAVCIGKIAIAPAFMESFVESLQANLAAFKKSKAR